MPAEASGEEPNDGAENGNDSGPDNGPADPVLIAAVRRGDTDAAGVLFRRHRQAAIKFAAMNTNATIVEDVVSEAFERVFAALYQGKGPDSFRPYLFTTIRRVAVDMHRRHGREVAIGGVGEVSGDSPPPELVSEDETGANLDAEMVRRAFLSLPERWRQVLWYTAVESRSLRETAELIGANPNSAAVLGFRAREGLRNAYLAQHVGAEHTGAHRQVLDLLPRWIRGGLPRSKARTVDQHLETCASCAAVADEVAAINAHLSSSIAPLLLGVGLLGPTLGIRTVAGSSALHAVSRLGLNAWKVPMAVSAAVLLASTGALVLTGGETDPRHSAGPPVARRSVAGPDPTLRGTPSPSPSAPPERSGSRPSAGSLPSGPAASPPTAPPSGPPTQGVAEVLTQMPAHPPTLHPAPALAPLDVRVEPGTVEPIAGAAQPWQHLRVAVHGRGTGPAPALALAATLAAAAGHHVHSEDPFGAWSCQESPDGDDVRLSCSLPAGAARQDLGLDLLPRGAGAMVRVVVRAVGVPELDESNNTAVVVVPPT